jgi:hypothetical protein
MSWQHVPTFSPWRRPGLCAYSINTGKNLIRAELEQIDAKASEASDGIAAERGDADTEGTRE